MITAQSLLSQVWLLRLAIVGALVLLTVVLIRAVTRQYSPVLFTPAPPSSTPQPTLWTIVGTLYGGTIGFFLARVCSSARSGDGLSAAFIEHPVAAIFAIFLGITFGFVIGLRMDFRYAIRNHAESAKAKTVSKADRLLFIWLVLFFLYLFVRPMIQQARE